MKNKFLILLTLFLISLDSYSQTNSFKNSSPLNIPLILSGTFGELRANHFHAGIDIKTNGKEGYQVKSLDDGYVDRIRVGTNGYGKALYINHPNGLTTVYAHLMKFSPKIQSFVKSFQYKKETYEIQLFPKDDEIKVKAGEIIGLSGNTGGSSGPHLHFEIRNTKNQKTINPLYYLDIKNLSDELEKLSVIKKELDSNILLLKEENKSLKIANNLLGSKDGNVITKNKIKSIIKEVDSCINLITDIK